MFSVLAVPLVVLSALAPASAQQYRTLTPEAGAAPAGAGRRVALVIGNAAYTHATPLRNAANDATDMAAALRRVGFTVVSGTDLSHESMDRALAEFTTAARGADAAAFFYAGHGVEVAGQNYLIPADADIQQRGQVQYRALALGAVMNALDETGAHLKLVVLDACRNDPFRGWRSAGGEGLAAASGPPGTVVVYATGPGSVASDNPTGRNGLFTSALLAEVAGEEGELSRVLRRVQRRVQEASGGEQVPWVQSSFTSDFYFVPDGVNEVASLPPSRPPAAAPSPPAAVPPSSPGGQPGQSRTFVDSRAIFSPVPIYPEAARAAGLEGRVSVRVRLALDGTVQEVQIAGSRADAFNDPVLDVIRTWRFTPALEDGRPVQAWYLISIDFYMRSGRVLVGTPGRIAD